MSRIARWMNAPLLFWRKLLAVERKIERIDSLLRASLDITKMPPARGRLRLLQLANAAFLRKVTMILEQHEIPYWINFGTLLGAVRHGGFIPWDDDLDISILRDDRKRMMEVLNHELCADGSVKIVPSDCVRVRLLGTLCQIDIFASDVILLSSADTEACERFNRDYREMQSELKVDFGRLRDDEGSILNRTDAEVQDMGHKFSKFWSKGNRKFVVGGFEGMGKIRLLDWDWIFPLEKRKFEGLEFLSPRNPDAVLSAIYGDYMVYPQDFHVHFDDLDRGLTQMGGKEMLNMIKSFEMSMDGV